MRKAGKRGWKRNHGAHGLHGTRRSNFSVWSVVNFCHSRITRSPRISKGRDFLRQKACDRQTNQPNSAPLASALGKALAFAGRFAKMRG